MAWSAEWESFLEDAPWPASKDELLDFTLRSGSPADLTEFLEGLPDDGRAYESAEDVRPADAGSGEFVIPE